MSLGKRIKILRTDKSWTQKDLAEKAGISQKYISTYEDESVIPTATVLRQIIIALEADPFYLLDIPNDGIKESPSFKLIKEIDSLGERERTAVLVVIENFLELNRTRPKKRKKEK